MRRTAGWVMVAMGVLSCWAGAEGQSATRAAAYSHEAATALYRHARYAEEEAMCRAEIGEIEKREGAGSAKLAGPLDDLAGIYLRQGRFAEAKGPLAQAEKVLDRTKPAEAIAYAHLCINKGWLQYSLGDVAGAEKTFVDGRTLLEKYQQGPSVDLAELINNIGLADEDDDDDASPARTEKAKRLLLEGWELRRKLTGEESAETGESLNNLGMFLLYHSEDEEGFASALTTLKKSLAISEIVYGKENPETAVSLTNLAIAHHLTQQDELAEPEIRRALPMTEKFLGKENPDRAYELQVLGQILQAQEKYREAEGDFQEAVRLTEQTYGAEHEFVGSALEYLQGLYEARGDEVSERAVKKRIERIKGRDI